MGFFKTFLKKVGYHAAVAYGGYQVGDYVRHEDKPIIVKPEIVIPPQQRDEIAPATHILIIFVILVNLSFLLITIKYIIPLYYTTIK